MSSQHWGRVAAALAASRAVKPNPMLTVYAALKACKRPSCARKICYWRWETPPSDGITVNVLSPGAIGTDRNAPALADPAYRARVEAQIPLGRIG